MIRGLIFAATAGLAALTIAPQPLAAQEADPSAEADEMQQAMEMLGAMFPAEPLTADHEGRLPQATRIMATIIPEATLAEMAGSMFDKMLGLTRWRR